MQRVHMDDLVGYVTRHSNEWVILKLPAIATEDQRIKTGPGQSHLYRASCTRPESPSLCSTAIGPSLVPTPSVRSTSRSRCRPEVP